MYFTIYDYQCLDTIHSILPTMLAQNYLVFSVDNVFPELSHIVPMWTHSIPALYPDPILPNFTVPP